MRRGMNGFSVFQQLVLVASIFILVVALASTREKARLMTCQSHLRQLSAAIFSYSADWQNRLPVCWINGIKDSEGFQPLVWDRAIRPYLKNKDVDIVTCPGDKKSDIWINKSWLTTRSYTCTAQLFGGSNPYKPDSKTLNEIPSPSITVMLAERPHNNDFDYWESYAVTDFLGYDNRDYIDWLRHDGAANFAFADGHVRAYHGKPGGRPGSCPKFPGYTYNLYGAALCGCGDPLPAAR